MMANNKKFDGVVTLYNRYLLDGKESWKRTVLRDVVVLNCNGEAIRHSGAASTSARRIGSVSVGELLVLIPCRGRKDYCKSKVWRQSGAQENRWTLQPGDLLVVGECESEAQQGTQNLMSESERCAVISKVTDYSADKLLPHWEVVAR